MTSRQFALATSATVVSTVSLFIFAGSSIVLLLRFYGRLRWQQCYALILSAVAATAALAAAALALTTLNIDEHTTLSWTPWQIAGLALGGLYILSVAAFLLAVRQPILVPRSARNSVNCNDSFIGSELKDSPSTINKSIYDDSPVSSWRLRAPPAIRPAPYRTHTTAEGQLQPKSSRTRLLRQPSAQTFVSHHTAIEPPTATDDSFSTWPLDSPTYDIPDSPVISHSLHTIPDSPSRSTLRAPSPAFLANEAHIHPLFRSGANPPRASPDTTIYGHGDWSRPGSSASLRRPSGQRPSLRAVQSEECMTPARRRAGTGLNLDAAHEV